MSGEQVERRLAAILAADVAGYSRLMGADEVGTLAALKAHRREVVDPAITQHHGRIVKTTGDGMLVEFASAVDAVTCAMAVQEKMAERTAEGTGPHLQFRVGINVGDIIIDNDDIFGDGVNVAARVENECEPGGVCLSSGAFEQVRGKTVFAFDDLGERSLKNIDRPVRIFGVRPPLLSAPAKSPAKPEKALPLPDKPSIAVLPFTNMSGDPEQEYFADGMVRPMQDRSKLAESVLEQLADAIICADRSGAIIRWNRASAALFGHSSDEALGQSLDLIIPEHLRARHWSGFDTAVTTGGTKLQGRPYSDACGTQKRTQTVRRDELCDRQRRCRWRGAGRGCSGARRNRAR